MKRELREVRSAILGLYKKLTEGGHNFSRELGDDPIYQTGYRDGYIDHLEWCLDLIEEYLEA